MIEKRSFIWVGVLALVLISIPYLFAFKGGNNQWVFGGFLLNPVDGHSYLAKMQQGFQGNWKFLLPYTAEPGEGAYLFILYISLGHIARILNLPLILVFHIFRLIGSIVLLYSLWKLSIILFTEKKYQLVVFCLMIFGSGLGWIGVLAGQFTSDFWVAEAYPFLSMYANSHFPLGLGIMICMLLPGEVGIKRSILFALILSIVQPFAVVIFLVIMFARVAQKIFNLERYKLENFRRIKYLPSFIGAAIGGGLILLYQYSSILNDPVLSNWNAQNLTPPPSAIDFILAFSPVLILAGYGIKESLKSEIGRTLVVWAISCIGLLLIPWNLQRRFLTGIYVPLAGLAGVGLKQLISKYGVNFRTSIWILFVLVLPTNLIVLMSGIQASVLQDKNIYYSAEIEMALEWITRNTDPDDLFLTDKSTGLLIPSLTGRRVIYGHPFETVNAEDELKFIDAFFQDQMEEKLLIDLLTKRKIGYILIQKGHEFANEQALMAGAYRIVFENSKILLYQKDLP